MVEPGAWATLKTEALLLESKMFPFKTTVSKNKHLSITDSFLFPSSGVIWFGLVLDKVPFLLREMGGELGAISTHFKNELNVAHK